jgi:hypothetical protein
LTFIEPFTRKLQRITSIFQEEEQAKMKSNQLKFPSAQKEKCIEILVSV